MRDDRDQITDTELDQILRAASGRLEVPPMRDAVAPARAMIEARANSPTRQQRLDGRPEALELGSDAVDLRESTGLPLDDQPDGPITFEPEQSRWREIGLLVAGAAAAAVLILALVAVFGGIDSDGTDEGRPASAPELGAAYEIPGFEFVGAYGAPKAPNEPIDAVIGEDGTRYVADVGLGRVVAFSPEGEIDSNWGEDGLSSPLDVPYRIAMGPDGELYVLGGLGGRTVYKLSRDGNLLDSWEIPLDIGEGNSDAVSGRFSSIAVDSEGSVYVSYPLLSEIQVWDSNGEFVEVIELDVAKIGGMAIDSQDRLYVTTVEDGLRRVSPDGSTQPLEEPVTFAGPATLSIGADDTIVVLSATGGAISRFDLRGAELHHWQPDIQTFSPGSYPLAIVRAVGLPGGGVHVNDPARHRILTYSPDGELVSEIVDERPGTFGRLWRVAVADDGDVFGLDPSVEGRILEFEPSGELQQEIDLETNPVRAASAPWVSPSFALASDGRIIFADSALSRVYIYAADGTLDDEWSSMDPSEFAFPRAIAAGDDEFIYVADETGMNPKKIRIDGEFVASLGDSASQRYDLAYHDDAVWMTDGDNGQVIRYSVESGEPEVIATAATETDSSSIPGLLVSLDLDAGGNIYVYSVPIFRVGPAPAAAGVLTKLDPYGNVLWSAELFTGNDRYLDIAIGPDGTLYLADSDLHQILAYRPVEPAEAGE